MIVTFTGDVVAEIGGFVRRGISPHKVQWTSSHAGGWPVGAGEVHAKQVGAVGATQAAIGNKELMVVAHTAHRHFLRGVQAAVTCCFGRDTRGVTGVFNTVFLTLNHPTFG